jgi:DNA-binding MarR family transcriptional regulator
MEHPIKVARELAKYGYEITISEEFDGLSKEEQEEISRICNKILTKLAKKEN